MKKFTSILLALVLIVIASLSLVSCDLEDELTDEEKTMAVARDLKEAQPTPTDINYSLERYNLIRRAYWVNGQREKANSLVCEIEKPLGYIVLFQGNTTIGSFIVDGKVSSLNSYLTPDSEYYEQEYISNGASHGTGNHWLADVDGSYGENDNGIFFFTPDGKYVEWTGTYLYSDIPFEVKDPVVMYQTAKTEE